MKKIYSLLLFCSLAVSGFSQIDIYEYGQAQPVDLSGTTYTKIVDYSGNVTVLFTVKNLSGNLQEVDITRKRLTYPATWQDGLSWQSDDWSSGAGYAPSQMQTDPWTTPLGVPLEDSASAVLVASIYADAPGTGTYRYYMTIGGTYVDSIDVKVIYSTAAVIEPEIGKSVTAYPNPASDLLTVNATGLEEYRIRVTDVLGKIVYEETASSPKKSIDVTGWKNGVYLLTVLEKGVVIRTRRVVVKH